MKNKIISKLYSRIQELERQNAYLINKINSLESYNREILCPKYSVYNNNNYWYWL